MRRCTPAKPVIACRSAGQAFSAPSTSDLDPELFAKWKMLRKFTIMNARGNSLEYTASREKRQELGAALLDVYAKPNPEFGWSPVPVDPEQGQEQPPVMMGVCASNIRTAVRAYRDWCQALGVEFVMPVPRTDSGDTSLAAMQGGVYIKYNATGRSAYASIYFGKDHGVLVQLGQAQLGSFPLGLWDEDQKNPPVEIC